MSTSSACLYLSSAPTSIDLGSRSDGLLRSAALETTDGRSKCTYVLSPPSLRLLLSHSVTRSVDPLRRLRRPLRTSRPAVARRDRARKGYPRAHDHPRPRGVFLNGVRSRRAHDVHRSCVSRRGRVFHLCAP